MAIARALVGDPAIVLADEPTGNLDSRNGEAVMALFQALHRDGRTIVVITHDAGVAAIAPRRVTMRDGRIVADEGPGPASAGPTSPWVEAAVNASAHAAAVGGAS